MRPAHGSNASSRSRRRRHRFRVECTPGKVVERCRCLPPPSASHPPAADRGDGQRAVGAGTGRPQQGGAKHQPCSCAAGGAGPRRRAHVQAVGRVLSQETKARSASWPDSLARLLLDKGYTPPSSSAFRVARIPQPAGRRTDAQRTGAGTAAGITLSEGSTGMSLSESIDAGICPPTGSSIHNHLPE